jgi:glycosyltransferase involved in cell wall biosynthesis
LKVCILTTSFPRFKGDFAGIFIYQLSKWLALRGIEIEILAPHDSGIKFFDSQNNIKINRFPYFFPLRYQQLSYGNGLLSNLRNRRISAIQIPSFMIAEFLFLLWTIKKKKIDLIHAHWSLPQGLLAVICKRVFKIPCVTTFHGSDIYGLKRPIFRSLNRMTIRGSNICTANSSATAQKVREIYGRKDIKIIPMGVNPDIFTKIRASDDMTVRMDANEEIILFVGRLIDLKGVEYLIRALPRVLQKRPLSKILVVGEGPMKESLVALRDRLNLETKISFEGHVSHDRLSQYFSTARLFVLPSIVNEKGETEGLGVVLLEAMACRVPVIGTDVGGIPDIIYDGKTGLLARQKDPQDLGNQMIRLLSDENLRTKIVSNAQDLIQKKFSWEVIADRFIEIYRDLLEDSRA